MRTARGMLLVAATVAVCVPRARAGTEEEALRVAAALFDRGKEHYRAGRFEAALEAFRAAARLAPAPALHYNIAQAHRQLGQCAAAARRYRSFLEAAPDAENRIEVEGYLDEMERCVRAPPVRVATSAPLPALASGSPLAIPAADPDEPAGRGRALRWTGIGVAAAGVAGLAAGAFLAKRASDASDEITAITEGGGRWTPELERLESRRARDVRWSHASYATGAAALVTGGLLYVLGWREGALQATPVTPSGGIGLALSGCFQ